LANSPHTSWSTPRRLGTEPRTSCCSQRELIVAVGLDGAGERARPRPHDLRHAFAVRTLINWHRDGIDIRRELPRLSTYLGHVSPESSFWYLQAVPELLELAARDLDQLLGGEA
jgi:integrase/recombinase XerD